MGFMTVAILLNDAWDQYQKHPEQLVEGLTRNGPHARDNNVWGQSSGVGNYANPVVTFQSRHADEPQLILAHQNSGVRLGYRGARGLDERMLGYYEQAVDRAESQIVFARESIEERRRELDAEAVVENMEADYRV